MISENSKMIGIASLYYDALVGMFPLCRTALANAFGADFCVDILNELDMEICGASTYLKKGNVPSDLSLRIERISTKALILDLALDNNDIDNLALSYVHTLLAASFWMSEILGDIKEQAH